MNNCKIIIQARSGSTRLPNKMNLPFYKDLTILDVIFKQLLQSFSHSQIILATTIMAKDDLIARRGEDYNLNVFRGDENNVLDRFIESAKKFNAETIIRVCADNPFINADFIEELINNFKNEASDYLSFSTKDNTPSIKTHYGFFAEITSLKTLVDVSQETDDKFYMEHVTNYIYAHPEKYKINFVPIPDFIEKADIRLTVDTLEDFNVCKEIYSYLVDNNLKLSPENIINYINQNKHLHKLMTNQINLNKK